MSNRYRVPVSTWVNGTVDVIADSPQEALTKAEQGELAPGTDWPDTKRGLDDLDVGDQWEVPTDPDAAVPVPEDS